MCTTIRKVGLHVTLICLISGFIILKFSKFPYWQSISWYRHTQEHNLHRPIVWCQYWLDWGIDTSSGYTVDLCGTFLEFFRCVWFLTLIVKDSHVFLVTLGALNPILVRAVLHMAWIQATKTQLFTFANFRLLMVVHSSKLSALNNDMISWLTTVQTWFSCNFVYSDGVDEFFTYFYLFLLHCSLL